MTSTSYSGLQLPTFTPLEPLTNGTNLPPVRASDLDPIESPAPTKPSLTLNNGSSKPSLASTTPPSKTPTSGTFDQPPLSPGGNGKAGSMRHFLSRKSMQSVHDDKSSIFSSSPSTLAPDGKRAKKAAWWKRGSSKRQSALLVPDEVAKGLAEQEPPVQSGPPPPRIPDDLFGKNLSSMDGDMFKDLK